MLACPRPGVYVPRQTHDCDAAVLVRLHLPGFLARLEEGATEGLNGNNAWDRVVYQAD